MKNHLQKQSSLEQIIKVAEVTLIEQIHEYFSMFPRGLPISIVFELFRSIQFYSLQLNPKFKDFFINDRQNMLLFYFLRLVDIFGLSAELFETYIPDTFEDLMYQITTTIHSSILILIPLNLILIMATNSAVYAKVISKIIAIYLALVLKVYYHMLFLPFLMFHAEIIIELGIIDNPKVGLNLFNMMASYIIVAFITQYQIDYRIKVSDQLARRDEGLFQVQVLTETILIIIHSSDPMVSFNLMLHTAFCILKFTIFIDAVPYYNNFVQRLYFCVTIFHLFSSILYFLIYNTQLNFEADYFLMLSILLPFSIDCGMTSLNKRFQYITLWHSSQINSFRHLDIYARQILNFCQDTDNMNNFQYNDEVNLLIYDSILLTHTVECKKSQCLICSEYTSYCALADQQNIEMQQQKILQIYLLFLFENYFNSILHQFQSLPERFLFISFLIQVWKVPQKAYSELFHLRKIKSQMSFKDKYILYQIMLLNADQFHLIFHNSTIRNQRIQFKLVCDFDNQLETMVQLVKGILIQLRNFYIFLNQDYIDLMNLYNLALEILTKRQDIQAIYIHLFDINPDNKILHKCTEIFLKFFAIEKIQISTLVKNSKHLMVKDLKYDEKLINLFQPNSCTLFVSLLKPPGQIIQASNSVNSVFGFTHKECQGKDCSLLIPKTQQSEHQNCIERFVQLGDIRNPINEQNFVFGLHKSGFIVPLLKRLKLDFSADQFGLSCYFEKSISASECDFLLLDQDYTIAGASHNFFQYCFQKILPGTEQDTLRTFDARKIFPLLHAHINDKMIIKNVNTIMISPSKKASFNQFLYQQGDNFAKSLEKQLNSKNDIRKYQILEANISFFTKEPQQNKISQNYIQINYLRKLTSLTERIESVNLLITQLNSKLNLKIKLNKIKKRNSKLVSNYNEEEIHSSLQQQQHSQQQQSKFINTMSAQLTDTHLPSNASIKATIQQDENIEPSGSEQDNKPDISQKNGRIDINQPIQIKQSFNYLLSHRINEKFNQAVPQSQSTKNAGGIVQKEQMPSIKQKLHEIREQDDEYADLQQSKLQQQNQQKEIIAQESALASQILSPRSDFPQIMSPQHEQNQSAMLLPQQNDVVQKVEQPSDTKRENEIQSQQLPLLQQVQQQMFGYLLQQPIYQEDASSSNQQQKKLMQFEGSVRDQDVENSASQKSRYYSITSKFQENQIGSEDMSGQGKYSMQLKFNEDGNKNDQQSVNSSARADQTKQQMIMRQINSNQISVFLKKINVVGYMATIILCVCFIVLYVMLQNNFEYEQQSFFNMVTAPQIKIKIADIILNREFIQLYQIDETTELPSKVWHNKDLSSQQLYDLETLSLKNNLKKLNSLLQDLYKLNTDEIFASMQDEIELFTFNETSDHYHHNVEKLTAQYGFIFLIYILNQYQYFVAEETTLGFIEHNFLQYTDLAQHLMEHCQDLARNKLQVIQNTMITVLIIIELVAIILVSILFPIFIIQQKKRQQILKLFCTFPKEKLNFYISEIDQCSAKELQILVGSSIRLEKNINQKKKLISHTSELPKLSIYVIISSIIGFVVIQIYPLINLVQTEIFLHDFEYDFQDVQEIMESHAHFNVLYAYEYIVIRQVLQDEEMSEQTYNDLSSLINKNDIILNNFNKLEENFQTTRAYGAEYSRYLLTIQRGNICEELFVKYYSQISDLQENFKDYFKIACQSISRNVLPKGIVVSYQQISMFIKDFLAIVNDMNKKVYQIPLFEKLKQLDSDISFIEIHMTLKILSQAMTIAKDLLLEMSDTYIEQTQVMQTKLFGIFIVVIAIFFLLCWHYFLQYLSTVMNITKSMLGIFQIDYLLDNTYILHYINKELNIQKIG